MNQEPDVEPTEVVEVEDEAAEDTAVDVLPTYTIVSYGADFDVTSLVKRMDTGDIQVPEFQRGFVWTYRQAARFIESLLMGFPVPGIFLWRNPETERLVVVDGQQRLRTLQSYYRGILREREFALPERTSPYQMVNPRFQGKTYRALDDEDRRRLDNSIIHSTIVNQERPPEDDSSIFYLFERINTEGTPLQPEEIRTAIYQGKLIDLLGELNKLSEWREVYGPVSPRMKDRELILRFFALLYSADDYARPMKEFLNRYNRRNRHLTLPGQSEQQLTRVFADAVRTVNTALGPGAFRPAKAFNAAVYDSVMVGVARRLERGPIGSREAMKQAYDALMADQTFVATYTQATADAENVRRRLTLATDSFSRAE
jgi:hypothetical protein